MQIHEVEALVGLTKKSIRYYEEEGLINPKRNQNNDYREYSMDDVKALKLIKFLRELNVSVRDIKCLKSKELSLEDCMLERIRKIEEEEKNYDAIKNMCYELAKYNGSIDEIDITEYFEAMNVLNKRGFTMRDVSKNNKRKIWGAIVSSLIFSLTFIFLISVITYFQITEEEKMPVFLYLFFMIVFITPILGIIINLFRRIKEIRGGEEDEASKY